MPRPALFVPPPAATAALGETSARAPTWRLRLGHFAHARVRLEPGDELAPAAYADLPTLVLVHSARVGLVVDEAAAPLLLDEGSAVLLGAGGRWRLGAPSDAVHAAPRLLALDPAPAFAPRPPLPPAPAPGGAEVSVIVLGLEDEGEAEALRGVGPVLSAPGDGQPSPLLAALLARAGEHDARLFDDAVLFARALEVVVLELVRGRAAVSGATRRSPPIRRAVELFRRDLTADWRVGALAMRVGLSRSAFAARFTREVGEPPLHHLTRLRLGAAAQRLRQGEDEPLKSIAAAVGYRSLPSFCKAFRHRFGVAPSVYRRGAAPGSRPAILQDSQA